MPWSPQGGGQGPWGRGPTGPQQPDIEEIIRRGQENLRRLWPQGFGGGRGIVLALLAVVASWLASGFYRVQPAEQGVVLMFGKWVQTTQPGLNWFFPAPIGRVFTPNVEEINRVEVGYRSAGENARATQARDIPAESLILTGDQNISDIDFTVFWKIKDAGEFLFNLRNPEVTVKVVAESVMREVVGQTTLQLALTEGRTQIEQRTRELTQRVLDAYGAGISVNQVRLLKVDPPAPVIDSFNEVQRARQDKERKQNEAQAYRNRIIPAARGEAVQIVQQAEAYRERLITEAQGEAERFTKVYESYAAAPEVTSQRLYLETLESVLQGKSKVIIDGQANNGVVPYLALPEIAQRRNPPARAPQTPNAAAPARTGQGAQ